MSSSRSSCMFILIFLRQLRQLYGAKFQTQQVTNQTGGNCYLPYGFSGFSKNRSIQFALCRLRSTLIMPFKYFRYHITYVHKYVCENLYKTNSDIICIRIRRMRQMLRMEQAYFPNASSNCKHFIRIAEKLELPCVLSYYHKSMR